MEALLSRKFLPFSWSPPLFPFAFKPLPQPTLFLHFPCKRHSRNSKFPIFSSISASSTSNPTDFGGWDELAFSDRSGELDQFRKFLTSISADEKRHIFMFLIGFVSALTITRVKFSSVAVFPVSISVLLVGFFLGFVRGAHANGRARNTGNLWVDLDATLSELRNDMENAFHSDSFQVGELRRFYEVVESVRLKILTVTNPIETSFLSEWEAFTINNHIRGQSNGSFVDDVKQWDNEKSNKKKRKMAESSISFIRSLVGGLFRENSFDSKPRKAKDFMNRGSKEMDVESGTHEMNGGGVDKRTVEKDANPQSISNMENSVIDSYREALDNLNVCQNQKQGEGIWDDKLGTRLDGSRSKAEKSKVFSEMVGRNVSEMPLDSEKMLGSAKSTMMNGKPYKSSSQQHRYNSNMLLYDEELSHQNNRPHISNGYGSAEQEKVHNPAVLGMKRVSKLEPLIREDKASVQQEQTLDGCDGAYAYPQGQNDDNFTEGKRTFDCDFKGAMGKRVKSDYTPISDNFIFNFSEEVGEVPPSSTISYDEEFDLHMKEATNLLEQARGCLTGQLDEDTAELVLSKSANLLSQATIIKPMNLQAVGQLGNTFLLHGELKLKISRELRSLLSRPDSLSYKRRPGGLSSLSRYQILSRDKVASVLFDVCDECEQLLMEAGRRYRIALSIDANDMRALYNWGLALSFRAQLIADIGPEAAVDADKVYLAAIDKFDALISRSNAYAPNALFRWGMTLQQRSHLRPSNSKEKIKLLHQAKRLLEDALLMGADNLQVRAALSSCISELNHRHQ